MNKEKQNVKNSDALKGFLFRAYHACSFKTTRVEDPEQKRLRMTPCFNFPLTPVLTHSTLSLQGEDDFPMRGKVGVARMRGTGFTLIELLVVVLIIGILAAIALPQYQKAVWKSRFSEVIIKTRELSQATQLYVLQNGIPNTDRELTSEDLDINAFSGLEKKDIYNFPYYCSTYACYSIIVGLNGEQEAMVYALLYRGKEQTNLLAEVLWAFPSNQRSCYYEDELGEYLCSYAKKLGWENIDEGF